ncbi:MAG: hypothetical protein Q7T91_00725 [Sulfuricurvum sp.]|nr:hypothetical protein [Sulfuricurvum sp.]
MNKQYFALIKKILNISLLSLLMFQFTGCANKSKFYYTKAKVQEKIYIEKQIAVKIDVNQSGSSYTGVGLQTLTDDIKDLVFDNKLFIEESNSSKTLKINVKNVSVSGSAGKGGAVATGLTLGIVPYIADQVIIVNIQLDDFESVYEGEAVHTMGSGFAGEKYTEDYNFNLVKNLVKNALDEFTVKYYKYQLK